MTYRGLLFDLRPEVLANPGVYDHPTTLIPCRALGNEAYENALPGFLTYSARDPRPNWGSVAVVLNSDLLSEMAVHCYLKYRLESGLGQLTVERTEGETLMKLHRTDFKLQEHQNG